MGTSAAPRHTQAGFDAETFKKLVARFDSNHTGEAETAFRKAMLLCVQAQLRFCDAAAEAYAQNDRSSELEAELVRVIELLNQREAQGAALADARDKIEQEFVSYRQSTEQELTSLRQNAQPLIAPYCSRCEWKRALLALVAGWPIAKLMLARASALPVSEPGHVRQSVWIVLLASLPLLAVLARWGWLIFKQKHRWVSWRDNAIYRRIAAAWNALLQRLTMA